MTVVDDTSRYADPSAAPAVWNGSSWVPVVDPRPVAPLVLDDGSDRRALLRTLGVVVVLGLVLAGLGHVVLTRLGLVGDPGVTVIGTVDVVDLATNANGCQGVGAYAGVGVGAPVTLEDGAGTELGTGELADPVIFGEAGCVFTFRVEHVPTSAASYTVRVAGSEAAAVSRRAMGANGWTTEVHLAR